MDVRPPTRHVVSMVDNLSQALAATVLVVDDEAANVNSLERIFKREGMRVLTASRAKQALELARSHRIEVVVSDLMMPGVSGLELLKALKQASPATEVVLMTAYGTVENAVQAMREGAYDFVEKPLKRMQIVKTVRKAAERQSLLAENKSLRQEIRNLTRREIIGSSPALRRVLDTANQAAPSAATVMVLGESGTGKELLARYIHRRSSRSEGPFVAINCAAIPEGILEAELFGHERGAFTGAHERREGRFNKATGGTLFLDEIGELSPAVQVKLLRVLQDGEYEPLGGDTRHADVRVVAATNKNLVEEVRNGRFREDLYYRLNVISLTVPPLRSRPEDVALLVDHFVGLYCSKNRRPRLLTPSDVLERLKEYRWPGNVRELENAMERAVVLCRGDKLTLQDLPEPLREPSSQESQAISVAVGTPLDEVERRLIRETLRHADGDKSVAAQLLGISSRTIYRKLAEMDDNTSNAPT
jgi:DNA-binding NtrC family response regulator